MIDDDFHVQCFIFNDSFHCRQIDPQVIRVENARRLFLGQCNVTFDPYRN